MTYSERVFMPLDRQLFARDIAGALADLARQKHPTAKHLAKAWKIDRTTAENVFKGHLSITVLAKAIAAEGGELWDALGAEITGETYEQRQERKLKAIIKEAADARQNLHLLRTRDAILAERAAHLDATRVGPEVEPVGNAASGNRSADHSRRA